LPQSRSFANERSRILAHPDAVCYCSAECGPLGLSADLGCFLRIVHGVTCEKMGGGCQLPAVRCRRSAVSCQQRPVALVLVHSSSVRRESEIICKLIEGSEIRDQWSVVRDQWSGVRPTLGAPLSPLSS
jgi:hypothetical protein